MSYGKKIQRLVDKELYKKITEEERHITHSYVGETDSPTEILRRVNEILEIHNLEIIEIDGNNPQGYPMAFTIVGF